jgi:hypothetical protein
MIADAHPMRSGVPDCYRALYRIEVLVAATTWNVNLERFPSGFTGANVAAAPQQVRTGAGLGTITFPAGMRVRGANANYSPPSNADASQRTVHVCDIDETLGTALLVLKDDTGAIADPVAPTALPAPNDSWILVELTLETV